jgi:hypothetical protein
VTSSCADQEFNARPLTLDIEPRGDVDAHDAASSAVRMIAVVLITIRGH